ncbi:4-hydroxy-tetrahydrodipicolinate synthase [Pediococcus claussenii]|uniref:4-hydroxy-tetrahydrodipicolinate synthase n=1 Tax=Pediococcus claussenii (strain ATCC BAA-344 / DSM 14800 / JCM 18046 / KCTC 3811 / LMG 21948 / P06) TaxID=701521 RepID=G8PEU2_PEDCP|nr:4-hydroxy-tetrahydrodipicolinate synthase [Pediococcus claussenii]AEV94472.1 dihydrodipicolinate synthase [Pediococcus claussenii ATCC BAA-344]ANZ69691.1 4-hydroxy-tetrahydrodipicolinate synthase [Pediococcus claussenii]ANZ71508.1 4-hydroxy-tetrahydrodipicolinate synthase [Pediococcus claussenii]KRN19820.1 dapA protein [Pediococcus claussenii]
MFNTADLITALITPFDEQGKINFNSLERLSDHLLNTGSTGFLIGGTTGETPTLNHDEKLALYTKFSEFINDRVPIIAGTGSNNTAETIKFTSEVAKIKGINAALVVVPYYSKPNQRGMIAHFKAVAAASSLPILIYNIPGRTGVVMENETVVELSKDANIIGIKQCTNLNDIAYLVENTSDDFLVYTGEDAQTISAQALGATGTISVASHIYGNKMREMLTNFYAGNHDVAAKIQRELIPKMSALFMYPSPSPVKAVLNATGFKVGGTRLPILPLNADEEAKLSTALNVSNLSEL